MAWEVDADTVSKIVFISLLETLLADTINAKITTEDDVITIHFVDGMKRTIIVK